MIRSFRLRLALLSALLTGLVLALFGTGSWWLIRESKLQRLDSELRAYAEREVHRERTPEEWHRETLRITQALGLRDAGDVVLLQLAESGEVLFQSSAWPAAWAPAQLPWPAAPAPDDRAAVSPSLIAQAWAAEPPPLHPPPLHRPWHPPPPGLRERQESPPAHPPELIPAPLPAAEPQPPQAPAPPVPEQPAAPPPPKAAPGPAPTVALAQRMVGNTPWRMALARNDVARFAIAVNAQAIEADMRGIRNAYLLSLPLALLLTGLASWLFAGRALAPIAKLTAATRKVTAGGLDQRLGALGEDREFVELIEVFNRMLGRLERSFQQAHRFSADAAHELKTPLAIVQGQLERAIQHAGDGSPMQATLSSVLDEVRRLSEISRKLLMLSQADAGHLAVRREAVDLSQMLDDLLEDTRMLAPQLTVEAHIQRDLRIQADGSLLRQVLHNLISNAIKYNVEGGWIRIDTARWSGSVEVLVSNASGGISSAQRARLFERFFRADQAHSRQVEGVGLGLSVSREIARAHGGDLSLKGETQGVVAFSLVLPLV